jgi:hypothetical protein
MLESLLELTREQRIAVQAALNEAGYDVGTPDGVWGQRTRASIREMQASLGLAETGYVDAGLLKSLGVEVLGSASDSFVNAPLAKVHDPKLLRLLGEDEIIVGTLECLQRQRSVYGKYGDSYYFAVIGWSTVKSHSTAFEKCGGYLASITSRAENDFVYSMIAGDIEFFELGFDSRTGYSYKTGPFFGLWQDPGAREPAGGWRWRNGEDVSYTNWASHAPNEDRPGQNNAQYFADAKGRVDMTNADARLWFDNNGSFARGAVMEVDG